MHASNVQPRGHREPFRGHALTVVSANIEGLSAAKQQILADRCYDLQCKVLCLQETHLTPHKSISFFNKYGYSIFRSERTQERRGGLLTAVHSSALCSPSFTFTSQVEHQSLRITYHNKTFHLINVYDRTTKLDSIFYQQIARLPNLVLIGDFNAHHQVWGNSKNNKKGVDLLNIIDENNLCIHNDDSYTCIHPRGVSSLDLSITSSIALSLSLTFYFYR